MCRMAAVLLLVFCFRFECSSQQYIPQNIPTPNAASLGKYGDIPVSYHTGNPGISIPIHTLNVRNVPFPVTLDYDAQAVQMNAMPGWTGHNWTLNAGGVITRQINGNPDEYRIPAAQKHLRANGHREYDCYFKSCSTLAYYLRENQFNSLDTNLVYLERDFEPDVFYFSFLGKTGRFFLGNDGQWKVYSEDNLDILFNISDSTENLIPPFIKEFPHPNARDGQPYTIAGFRIRDDNGNMYEFGYDTLAIEYRTNMFLMSEVEEVESWFATSWYLTHIYDRFGNELYRLNYKRGYYLPQLYRLEYSTTYHGADSGVWWYKAFGFIGDGVLGNEFTEASSIKFPFGGELLSPVYLDEIICADSIKVVFASGPSNLDMAQCYNGILGGGNLNGGKVYGFFRDENNSNFKPFYYLESDNPDARRYQYSPDSAINGDFMNVLSRTRHMRLNSISIQTDTDSSSGNDICFHFIYDYSGRMHLASISRSHWGQAGSFVHDATYNFKYNHYELLPADYLTKSADHWGYYNGKTYSLSSLNRNFAAFKAYRDPDTTKMKYGVLTQITYPTGGASKISYESNRFSKAVTPDRQNLVDSIGYGGGIRVREIAEYEDSACTRLLKKRTFDYDYPNSVTSSGVLFAPPLYYWPDWRAYTGNGNVNIGITTFRSSSIIPLSNSFGPSVGYSFVKETFDDGSCNTYRYSNISDAKDMLLSYGRYNGTGTVASPYDKFCERGYMRGRLLNRTAYDKLGHKVRGTGYGYRTDSVEDKFVLGTNLRPQSLHASGSFQHFTGRIYKLFFPDYDIVRESDTLFFNGSGRRITDRVYQRSDVVLTSFNPYYHKSQIRELESAESITANDTTETSFEYPYESQDGSMSSLTGEFYILPCKQTHRRNSQLMHSDRTAFRPEQKNGRTLTVPDCEIRSYGESTDSPCDTMVTYDSYTATGAVESYTELGSPRVWLKWACGDSRLAAKFVGFNGCNAYGITARELFSTSTVVTKARGIFSSTPYTPINATFYSYHPIYGLASETDTNFITTYYIYDNQGHLIKILDNNQRVIKNFDYFYGNK